MSEGKRVQARLRPSEPREERAIAIFEALEADGFNQREIIVDAILKAADEGILEPQRELPLSPEGLAVYRAAKSVLQEMVEGTELVPTQPVVTSDELRIAMRAELNQLKHSLIGDIIAAIQNVGMTVPVAGQTHERTEDTALRDQTMSNLREMRKNRRRKQ